MKKLAISIVAAGTLLAAGTIAPAVAQVVIDGPGIDLRIGPNHPSYRAYNYERRDVDVRRRDRDDCRSVTVRERRPDGTVVTRTRERC